LHVRGPRITPEDFATLASHTANAESHWLLFFRGSGAFASRIAGPQRQLLSSDADSMFSSDPIALPLVLKRLRTNPAISFSSLADEVGPLTVSWYEERNLARTEEPTLWAATEKPRLLAGTAATPVERAEAQPEKK